MREQRRSLPGMALGVTGLLLAACLTWPNQGGGQSKKSKADAAQAMAAYAPEDVAAFSQRFQKDLWPLLSRNCTGCHTATNPSQLHFTADPEANFKAMLADGHFDPENPASLLARITSPDKSAHMPPEPMKSWTDGEVAVLRAFVNDIYAKKKKNGAALDEVFPAGLTTAFSGKPTGSGGDNTFLTYYQLKGKIKAIFGDEWKRDDKDLFEENLAQFGGADFVRSFNESSKPTAQFLSGVDAMAKDVASRAYLTGSGPFTRRADSLPSPLKMTAPDTKYSAEINRLYRRMLFRDATPTELTTSFNFLKSIYRAQGDLAQQDYDLRFELAARDEHGLTTAQELKVKVINDEYGLCQTLVDENDDTGASADGKIVSRKLNGPFTFKASDTQQQVVVSNDETRGNVIVSGIEVQGLMPGAGKPVVIPVSDPSVRPEGAWRMSSDNGVTCYEDDNQNKGASSLIFPLHFEQDGPYEISLQWRKPQTSTTTKRGRKRYRGPAASTVLVEVRSHDKHRLALPDSPPAPPKGEGHFTVDESDDTVQARDLKTSFQFGPGDGVEVSNANTAARVVADAMQFAPAAASGSTLASTGATEFIVPTKEAVGQDKWKDFKKNEYSFYKPIGPRIVSDEGDAATKGKLSLLYRPDMRPKEWKPQSYYRVLLHYPGEVQNDQAVPIIVHARASSPIVHLAYPVRGHVGASMTLDASGSYNIQNTPLQFTWRQVGGAKVTLTNPHTAQITFTTPVMTAQQAAWEGLCRALMKHPDFLFTRPLSLATAKDPATRRRLQLVKIAQDLVGRTPTAGEIAQVEKGAPLAKMVDAYLASSEFADFYFRRIRLYLESHGTDEEDEPARLWSYIAFNNHPYKEILSADYTVDTGWKQQKRPDYCGHSGVLTMKGFIKGKPGLPHFNYPAQVCEKFLGYVFEVPLEIVKIRNGIAAASTTSPSSVCYSCHKILTPLAYQRTAWTDKGEYKPKDDSGRPVDDTDQQLVPSYPFKGKGMEAFATQAQNKERFLRTIMQTHFIFYFGREMRYDQDERGLYKRLWDTEKANNYSLKGLIRTLMTSPEYLNGSVAPAIAPAPKSRLPHGHPRNLAQR